MTVFLSAPELVALTEYQRPADQMRWLRANKWPFEVSRKGTPKVLKAEMLRRMMGGEEQRRKWQPSFDQFNKTG